MSKRKKQLDKLFDMVDNGRRNMLYDLGIEDSVDRLTCSSLLVYPETIDSSHQAFCSLLFTCL